MDSGASDDVVPEDVVLVVTAVPPRGSKGGILYVVEAVMVMTEVGHRRLLHSR